MALISRRLFLTNFLNTNELTKIPNNLQNNTSVVNVVKNDRFCLQTNVHYSDNIVSVDEKVVWYDIVTSTEMTKTNRTLFILDENNI